MNKIDMMKKLAAEVTMSGLPFMEGKERIKVDTILNETLTVIEYGYLEGTNDNGDKEEYVVISLKEHDNNFIYGSSVVTQAFKDLETKIAVQGFEMSELLKEGLTFKLTKVASKTSKYTYTKIEFFPQ